MQEPHVRSLGQEDPLEKGVAIPSSILAWEIPRTEEPGRLQSMGSQRVGNDWAQELLYNIVLVLPYINMNPPRVYTYSPSWTAPLLPPHTILLGHPSAHMVSFIQYYLSLLSLLWLSYALYEIFPTHFKILLTTFHYSNHSVINVFIIITFWVLTKTNMTQPQRIQISMEQRNGINQNRLYYHATIINTQT